MDFDQETVRSSRSAAPAIFFERETDEIVAEGTVMAPRKEHPPDMIRIPFCSISVDAAIRIMSEVRKIGIAGVILIFLLIASSIAGARWGDPAVNSYLDRQKVDIEKDRALAMIVERLSANEADRQKRDQIVLERFTAILERLEKANR